MSRLNPMEAPKGYTAVENTGCEGYAFKCSTVGCASNPCGPMQRADGCSVIFVKQESKTMGVTYNVRLISAAPDLLRVLEDAAAELAQLHAHHHGDCDGGCPTDGILKEARSLIKQIKGQLG